MLIIILSSWWSMVIGQCSLFNKLRSTCDSALTVELPQRSFWVRTRFEVRLRFGVDFWTAPKVLLGEDAFWSPPEIRRRLLNCAIGPFERGRALKSAWEWCWLLYCTIGPFKWGRAWQLSALYGERTIYWDKRSPLKHVRYQRYVMANYSSTVFLYSWKWDWLTLVP